MALENKTLDDWQAAYLYKHNPGLGQDPKFYCPTCDKTGKYQWGGVENECDCRTQLNLHKFYLWSGIGTTYQRLGWDDYHGDKRALNLARLYVEKNFARRGTGLFFIGDFGTGKTMLANLVLKELIKAGMRCYATTFDTMISKYTGGWRDDEEREVFTEQVIDSQVLLLDDVGKTMRASAAARGFHQSTFDEILRPRIQGGRATLITTNMTEMELGEGYGAGILSLLRENAITHTFSGSDYRPDAGNRHAEELLHGLVRPII